VINAGSTNASCSVLTGNTSGHCSVYTGTGYTGKDPGTGLCTPKKS
jgi:hypothetical protein